MSGGFTTPDGNGGTIAQSVAISGRSRSSPPRRKRRRNRLVVKDAVRAVATFAGVAFGTSTLTAGAASTTTAATAPRTTAIAWADCFYGHESAPRPPLFAYALTPDGIVTRTRSSSVVFDDVRAESAVIGAKRFREIAEGIDRSTLFDPPSTPSPRPGSSAPVFVGHSIWMGLRSRLFAVRRDGTWTDWDAYREYTESQKAAIGPVYAAVGDPKLVWRPAAPRANAFALCRHDAPRDAMTTPASPSTSMWGVSEIVVADCHRGRAGPDVPPLHAYRLMRSGNVARTTADDGGAWIARRTESADVGAKTFADFAARLEKAGFFHEPDVNFNAVMADAPDQRIGAVRDDRRTMWSSKYSPSSPNYSDVVSAILAKVTDPGLSWTSSVRDDMGFSICTQ